MQVFLIEGLSKISYFKPIKLKDDKIVIKRNISKMNLKKKQKLVNQIEKILKINNSNKVIVSNNLKEDKDFINLLYSKQIDVIQGRYLFKILVNKIIENICNQHNIKQSDSQISVTVNNINSWAIKLIEDVSKKFKIVNVATNKTNYLKNLQKKLFDENGVIMTITNNKKKALVNAKLVINVDFPEEMINKYTINDEAIILNLEENIKIKKKRFNGKIINDYNIMLKKDSELGKSLLKDEYKNFDIRDLTEIYIVNDPKEIESIIICK